MRNKFFKFNENYAGVIKNLDDKQAGQYVKAITDYAFEDKTYGGKDITVKTAFTFTKQKIDEERFYREKGRLGGQKIAERKRETEEGNPILQAQRQDRQNCNRQSFRSARDLHRRRQGQAV